MLGGDVADQLLDEDGLAHAGAAEQADLAALHVRREEIDDLDAGLEDLDARNQVLEVRRVAVDRPALAALDVLALAVDHGAEDVEDPAQRRVAHRDRDRRARVHDVDAAGEPVGRVHGDGAHAVVAEMLLDLGDQLERISAVLRRNLHLERAVDRGQLTGEDGVDDDASDLDDLADIRVLRTHSGSWLGVGGECIQREIPTGEERARVRGREPGARRDGVPVRAAGVRGRATCRPPPGRPGRAFRRATSETSAGTA